MYMHICIFPIGYSLLTIPEGGGRSTTPGEAGMRAMTRVDAMAMEEEEEEEESEVDPELPIADPAPPPPTAPAPPAPPAPRGAKRSLAALRINICLLHYAGPLFKYSELSTRHRFYSATWRNT